VSRERSTVGRISLGAVLMAASYLVTLGWHRTAYHDWQGGLLVVLLVAFAVASGRSGHGWCAALTAPTVLTLLFAMDAATGADSDGLWPIGAAGMAAGSFLGVGLVAWVAAASTKAQYR
jgi:hypothetical protein